MPALQTSLRPQQYRPANYASPRPHMIEGFSPKFPSYEWWNYSSRRPGALLPKRHIAHESAGFRHSPNEGVLAGQSVRRSGSSEHDPEKWIPVFGKRSCSNNKLERDDDSKKSHAVLARFFGEDADRRRRGEVIHFGAVGTGPAVLRNVEDHAVGVLELALEVTVPLVAEVEEELAAGLLDAALGVGEIVDLEAEVVRADEVRAFLEIGRLAAGAALEIQERHVDHAVGHVDGRSDVEILAADAAQLEHLLVELRRLLEILHDDGDVAQAGH